jgi:hypothetical protein
MTLKLSSSSASVTGTVGDIHHARKVGETAACELPARGVDVVGG